MKKYIRQLYFIIAWLFARLILLLPYKVAVGLGGLLGAVAYRVIAKSRIIVDQNLKRCFPEKSEAELRRIGSAVFANLGKNAFELFSFPKLDGKALERLVTIENREGLAKAFEGGKGVLIASAHCGNWEMMAAALTHAGFPINVIAKRIYIEGLNNMLVGYRTSKGVKVILRSDNSSARDMLRSLRRNEAIGMLIDQDTSVQGVFVDYFGRPAWTPAGLASLALRTGCGVVLALVVREPGDRHRVVITGPIEMVRTGDDEKDVVENTQAITRLIEDHVRRYPSQWVWVHERWKTQQQQ